MAHDRLADEGVGERLSDAEALMWRLGATDARLRPTITVVAVLDSSPGVEAVAERAVALTRHAPRFAARVVPPLTSLAPPRLVPDDQFDLSAHVRVVAAPGAGTLDDVLALAGPMAADGLDPSRPLWQFTLVEGMAGGRAALVVRVHHALTDGVGALALAAVLFGAPADTPAGPGSAGAVGPGRAEGGLAAAVERLADDLAGEVAAGVRVLRRGAPLAAGLLRRAVGDPAGAPAAAASVVATARSVVTAAGLDAAPCSPTMTARSASVVLGHLEVDLTAVRRAGAAAGGATVNDVFVFAVLEGFRRYHAKHGTRPAALRVAVPVNLRSRPGDRPDTDGDAGDLGGNAFFPARVVLPLGHPDPATAMAAVHDAVAAARAEPAVGLTEPLAAAVARLPGGDALVARALGAVDVITSNVAGSPVPLELAGAQVQALIPFGPRSGAGCNVTTLSYAGTLHVGVNLDPAATPDTATLLDCLAGAFSDTVGAP
ncbi:MAG TPA: wax ester/triacylglycerol synthase domain-containing protein [Acidimicrobiales bacterium]|nr:wax ester/triacylglycerol synthase domain-containing protein [Acidimicrobiales bacterium]